MYVIYEKVYYQGEFEEIRFLMIIDSEEKAREICTNSNFEWALVPCITVNN